MADDGEDVREMLGLLKEEEAPSSESEWSSILGRLRLPLEDVRGIADDFVFFVILMVEVERILVVVVVLMGVGFDEAVKPAVTFLMALIPAVLLVGFTTVGAGAGSVVDRGRTGGGAAGICIVIWVDVFMPMTRRLLTSSYVAEGKVLVTEGDRDAWDKAVLRLVGSPFIFLRIIWVAAVNCGT